MIISTEPKKKIRGLPQVVSLAGTYGRNKDIHVAVMVWKISIYANS
tara:strand:+ start:1174 stop:1311 length:138 start_codon:yes stop_codon:yes gene_type:complete